MLDIRLEENLIRQHYLNRTPKLNDQDIKKLRKLDFFNIKMILKNN